MQQLKILLVQLYSNGDCLYATAVARQIKQDYPGSHLTWAIANFCKQIIDGNPHVDDVLVVDSVAKNDVSAYRAFRKKILKQERLGVWDKVFITNVIDDRQANYDGCIRAAVFRGYDKPISVPVQPVLKLSQNEKQKALAFAERHRLSFYKHVILFEFAPQSGQSKIDVDFAMQLAREVTRGNDVAIILSSASRINSASAQIIDGSELSLRETAALTHHCTFLLGCSSGITWISTSSDARQLLMIQLLDPSTKWVNPPSRDFQRFGLPTDSLIELTEFDREKVLMVMEAAFNNFEVARRIYHQETPLHFKTSRNIVYNLLCYLQFASIWKHIKVNIAQYGHNPTFYKEVLVTILLFPIRLISNVVRKRLLKERT